MNIDPRGVKRGRCEACSCESYECISERGAACVYCQCAPTKHLRLDVSASAERPTYTVSDVILTSPVKVSSEFDFGSCARIEPVPEPSCSTLGVTVEETPSVTCSSKIESGEANVIPKKLPPEIENALKKKNVTPKQRCKIVRLLTDRFFAEGLPSSSVDVVADMAVEKWSPLKGHFGRKSTALAQQIRRRLSKVKSNVKSKEKTVEVNDNEEADKFNISEMQEEMKDITPSITKLKQFLTATRTIRKSDSSSMSAELVLKKYPALKIKDLLLWEFTQLVNITQKQMEERWQAFCDAMINYLSETENYVLCRRTSDFITMKILKKLPSLLQSGKRTKENTKYVLQMFEENTPIQKTIPQTTEPPRLIAIGSEENACFHCYVDGIPMFTTNNAVNAVCLILATYWIFNIEFPAECRPSLFLISSVLLKEKFSAKSLQKCGAVVGLLKQLKL